VLALRNRRKPGEEAEIFMLSIILVFAAPIFLVGFVLAGYKGNFGLRRYLFLSRR
jgi:hypothetical protein